METTIFEVAKAGATARIASNAFPQVAKIRLALDKAIADPNSKEGKVLKEALKRAEDSTSDEYKSKGRSALFTETELLALGATADFKSEATTWAQNPRTRLGFLGGHDKAGTWLCPIKDGKLSMEQVSMQINIAGTGTNGAGLNAKASEEDKAYAIDIKHTPKGMPRRLQNSPIEAYWVSLEDDFRTELNVAQGGDAAAFLAKRKARLATVQVQAYAEGAEETYNMLRGANDPTWDKCTMQQRREFIDLLQSM